MGKQKRKAAALKVAEMAAEQQKASDANAREIARRMSNLAVLRT